MKTTTKDIIAFLPFKKEFKIELLEKMEKMDEDTRLAIVDILWETYDALTEIRFQKNLKMIMDDIVNKKIPAPENIHKFVEEKTEKEMQSELIEDSTQFNIENIRVKIKNLMK